MRKVAILKTVYDRDFSGSTGLSVLGTRLLDDTPMVAFDSLLIAHDLIEHINGVSKIGCEMDELEALGVSFFVRGQFNELRRYTAGDISEAYAADLANICEDFLNRESQIKKINTKACEHDATFEDFISMGEKLALSSAEICYDPKIADRVKQFFGCVLGYLRKGYRKAAKKYPHAALANALFWEIADCVESVLKTGLSDGQAFKLHYGIEHDEPYCNIEGIGFDF